MVFLLLILANSVWLFYSAWTYGDTYVPMDFMALGVLIASAARMVDDVLGG